MRNNATEGNLHKQGLFIVQGQESDNKSDNKSKQTGRNIYAGNMNMAVHKAAAAAEVFRSGTDMEDYLKEEYSYYEKEDNTFLVSFAADWENCKTKDAEYTLWITLGEAKQRMVGHFAVKQKNGEKDKIIYEVELKRVISQREAAEDE